MYCGFHFKEPLLMSFLIENLSKIGLISYIILIQTKKALASQRLQ